jgi:hypothetical protein
MSCVRLAPAAAVLVLISVSGCGGARMIQSGPDGGVVAIPSNSNYWPCKYRDSAVRLMEQKCPNGYQVVREEEVVVGQKSTTSEQTDHITPAGFKDNRERTTTSVTTTTRPETEYRITFRSLPTGPATVTTMPAPAVPAPVPAPVLAPVSASSPPAPAGLPPRPVPVLQP